LQDGSGIVEEKRPEDYLIRGLIDFNDISYDDHAVLLYKLFRPGRRICKRT
jgi:type III restriction enzyme